MGHHVRTPGRSGSVSTGIAIQLGSCAVYPGALVKTMTLMTMLVVVFYLSQQNWPVFRVNPACPYIWLYGPKRFLNNQSCLPPSRSLKCMNVRTSSLHWFKFCARPFTRTFSSWSDEVFTCSNKAHRTSETEHPVLASGPETAFF